LINFQSFRSRHAKFRTVGNETPKAPQSSRAHGGQFFAALSDADFAEPLYFAQGEE
jgi:hypothetical protein